MGVPPSGASDGQSPRGDAKSLLEDYVSSTRQVMEAAGWPWPEHVLLHPKKMPRFVSTVSEFLHELQLGNHLHQIVVFPDGLRAIGQDAAVGAAIQKALGFHGIDQPPASQTAYDVLERLAASGTLQSLKGKVAFRRAPADRRDVTAGGSMNGSLSSKWADLQEKCPEDARSSVYCSEVRLLEAKLTEDGKRRKSTMQTTMRERAQQLGLQVENFLHWDDYSEGFFFGAANSGYGLHVDCIPTSNVGSVYAGHKLLAVWSYPEESRAVMKAHARELFVAPLSGPQVGALERACAVAVAPPGSIYIFSGAEAHAVANVGFTAPSGSCPPRPSMVASSYEAFVGLNTRHAEVMVQSCHDAADSDSDIEDFQDEVATSVKGLARRLIDSRVAEVEVVDCDLPHGLTVEAAEAARTVISFLRDSSKRIGNAVEDLEERMQELEASLEGCPRKRRCRRQRQGRWGGSSSSSSSASTKSSPGEAVRAEPEEP